ncbi:hypothetical protein EJ02DRAFT_503301 [Clathrospora elynae]|uniref:Gfd2/YDR514C-like C-terminal domain-containing protein n=1 Tax=Clathrospora elynae TaxID=706981 RepID=A0A6A5SQ23_9PLEO|nr:hypothetical protein EJ02DRAFT_503301 [Clathrospora elynae]
MDNVHTPRDWNADLTSSLEHKCDKDVLLKFLGSPLHGAPVRLNEAAVVCIDAEWWMREPKPTTELGVAEMMSTGLFPDVHAANILAGIRVAHARTIAHAHLRNNFPGAGDPENFHFGTSKFVTEEELKQVLIDTFVRERPSDRAGNLQPIILVGHVVENEFDHMQSAFGVDLRSYGTIVKVIYTQVMAHEAGIKGPKGPNISLRDLLAYFNIAIPDMHTAGNDAAGTLIAAILLALKDTLYPGTVGKPPVMVQELTVQNVVNGLGAMGKALPAPSWGMEVFCTRCDRDNHVRANCFAKVQCDVCRGSGVKRLYNASRTHVTARYLYQYQDLPPRDFESNGWMM